MSLFEPFRLNPNFKLPKDLEETRDYFNNLKRRALMEEAKTREQILVEAFRGLSLAETADKIRSIGVRVDVIDGLIVLHHPLLDPEYEFRYPGTLILIKGRREE